MSELNHALTANFGIGGDQSEISTQQNVKVNGLLGVLKFTPTAEYIAADKYGVLKSIQLSMNLRTKDSSTLIIDTVPLFLAVMYSDSIGGCGLKSREMVAGQEYQCEFYLPIGYFNLGGQDSLDYNVNVVKSLPFNVKLDLYTSYDVVGLNTIRTYKRASATGSDQTYSNVIGMFAYAPDNVQGSASIKDQTSGNHTINIAASIAKLNATGRFEQFTNFGELFNDPFDVGQSVTAIIPNDQNIELLIVSYNYDTTMLVRNAAETDTAKTKLYTEIINAGGNKLNYLRARGIIE